MAADGPRDGRGLPWRQWLRADFPRGQDAGLTESQPRSAAFGQGQGWGGAGRAHPLRPVVLMARPGSTQLASFAPRSFSICRLLRAPCPRRGLVTPRQALRAVLAPRRTRGPGAAPRKGGERDQFDETFRSFTPQTARRGATARWAGMHAGLMTAACASETIIAHRPPHPSRDEPNRAGAEPSRVAYRESRTRWCASQRSGGGMYPIIQ